MKIEIIDCNNWIRKVHEKDTSGLVLRNQFTDAYYNTNPIIYVFDGENGKAARRKIFPGYKSKRKPASDAFYVVLRLFQMLVTYTNKTSICIPGHEADDVIGTLIKGRSFNGIPVEIRSTDADYLALCIEGVTVSEPSKKLEHIPAEHIRLYKTLCGDTSDSIPGLPTFGPKTFEGVMEKGVLPKWYEILNQRELGLAQAADLHVTSGQFLWLQTNWKDLLAYWDIINFIDVPQELMDKHTIVGKPNLAAANAILKTVLQ